MHLRRAVLASALAALLGLAGSPVSAGSPDPADIRVMTLNVFYGGDELNLHPGGWCTRSAGCPRTLQQVIHVIDGSGADIVGIEEGEHNAGVIADALGWYASDR